MRSPQYLTPADAEAQRSAYPFVPVWPPYRDRTTRSLEFRGNSGAWLAGSIEYVPIGDPVRRFVPMRDPVSSGTDDAIKRFAGSCELRAGLGRNNSVDKRVHRRIGDAGAILRALRCGRLG